MEEPIQLDPLLPVLVTVEAELDPAPLHLGDEVHRPAPEQLDVLQRVAGVVELQVDAVVQVDEELLPLVLEVPVLDRDVAGRGW